MPDATPPGGDPRATHGIVSWPAKVRRAGPNRPPLGGAAVLRYHGGVTRNQSDEGPEFYCDAMLGGLARWLRAAGYDAEFEYGIEDGVLVDRAREARRVLLSSDSRLFERNVIKNAEIRALFVPRGLDKLAQLEFVMRELSLGLREPRCMGCGGELREVPKHEAAGEAPPLAFRSCDRFWRCARCGKLLWHGTHWQTVTRRLREVAERV